MKSKWIIAVVLIAALLGLCGLMAFLGWATLGPAIRGGISLGPVSLPTHKAEETKQETFTVKEQVTIDLENYTGDIQVSVPVTDTTNAGQVQLVYHKTSWGNSEAEAQDRMKTLTVSANQNGNILTIRVNDPNTNGVRISSNPNSVDFTLLVPATTTVHASTNFGDVTLRGTRGKADLSSSFGNILVQDFNGGLNLSSSSGKVTASKIGLLDGGNGDVTLRSDFGAVSLQDVVTTKASAVSKNGAVTFENVTASGEISLNSDFGEVKFEGGKAGSLKAETSNGKVTLKDVVVSGKITATSQFGDIQLQSADGSEYELHSANGAITADLVRGLVKGSSDFGSIEISGGENAVLDLETKNGKITYTGSLAAKNQSIKSEFGEIRLTLPSSSAFNLDLKTDFGKVSSELPITLNGSLAENHWQGVVNGGGAQLIVLTNNGNITIQSSK